MAKNVNQTYEPCARDRLANTSGADVVIAELCLLGLVPAVAEEDIASEGIGGFLLGGNGAVFQASDFVEDEGTFATANSGVYFDTVTKKISDTKKAGYYLVGQVDEVLTNGVMSFILYDTATLMTADDVISAGTWFKKTVTLTSEAAATAVSLLSDEDVGTGTAFIMGAFVKVNGAVAWTDDTATKVTVQDTEDVAGLTIAKAGLTANAFLTIGTANITVGDPIALGAGFTATKGIEVVADAVFAAGSDLEVTIVGYVA